MRRPVLSSSANGTPHFLSTHLLAKRDIKPKETFPATTTTFASFERGECVNTGSLLPPRSSSSHALFSMLLCSRSSDAAHCCIPSFHATLFSSLAFNDPSLSASEASLFSGCAVSGFHCIQQLDRYVHQKETLHNAACTALLQQLQLVRLMTSASDESITEEGAIQAVREKLCTALEGSQPLPKRVLSGLLKLACHPVLLRELVQYTFRSGQGKVEADVFETVMHALFANDNFFRLKTFLPMHELVELVLSATQAAAIPFDFITVKWTPLMTKWARVYTKMFKGDLLYTSFQHLMAAVPEAEVKIPSSFYVYLLGALLDANVYAATATPPTGWDEVLHVAQQALRLHGRSQRELHALWIIVLKAALIMRPPRRECERLLQAYHLCTAAERPAPMNKEAFSQLTRYMCAALSRGRSGNEDGHGSSLEEARALVLSYSKFVLDREELNFLWVVNAIGVIGGELWEHFGASAQSIFSHLTETLEKALVARDVAGFHIENNPPLAKLMERFGIGKRVAFWWTCGCGYASPATCSHCLRCTQQRKAMWSCADCGALHSTPCGTQRCHCGQPNPRLSAAVEHNHPLCPSCGGVCDTNGVCVMCASRQGLKSAVFTCTFCKTPLKSHALYCPTCFTPTAGKRLSIWYCASCNAASLSNFSACHTCGEKRRTYCLTAPFVPWHCGCGTVCHPCQWACRACSSSSAASSRKVYTCVACGLVSGLHTTVTLQSGVWDIPVKLCEHCGEVHPHDRETLESPKLPRHCALCGTTVPVSNIFLNGGFYHCCANQWVNENMPFQCIQCDRNGERQFGYQCRFCGRPRKETYENTTTFVWRCLCETEADANPCGQWNYSWNDHCTSCGHVRVQSEWECRARSFFWECDLCHHENLPTDICFCHHCGKGIQVPLPCETCGRSHLALSCY